MKDDFGRVIDRLRVSVTDRCDLRCVYCMPLAGLRFLARDDLLRFDEIEEVVRLLVERAGLRRVRITGGEPLVRPGLPELIGRLAALGLDEIAMTTNAQLLAPAARELKSAGLSRVNVSIDTLRPERFRRLARAGDLGRTIDGIDAAIDAGLEPVKLNVVVMRGWNDDEIVDVMRFAADREIEVRYLELMSIGEAGPWRDERFFSMEETIERLRTAGRLEPAIAEEGSTSVGYVLTNGDGLRAKVGFIAPVTRPFCTHCRRLRLSAAGALRGCLMTSGGVDVRAVLRGDAPDRDEALFRAAREAVHAKPWVSGMETGVRMHTLGG